MELTKSDMPKIFELIRLNYENSYACRTQSEMEILIEFWFDSLKEFSREVVFAAVKNAIKSSPFAPKISNVLDEVNKLLSVGKKSDVELWAELEEKMGAAYEPLMDLRYPQYWDEARQRIQEIYDGMSDDIKLYVVNWSTFVELANLDRESLRFEKARFLKIMPELRTHAVNREASERFLALCGAEDFKLLGGQK